MTIFKTITRTAALATLTAGLGVGAADGQVIDLRTSPWASQRSVPNDQGQWSRTPAFGFSRNPSGSFNAGHGNHASYGSGDARYASHLNQFEGGIGQYQGGIGQYQGGIGQYQGGIGQYQGGIGQPQPTGYRVDRDPYQQGAYPVGSGQAFPGQGYPTAAPALGQGSSCSIGIPTPPSVTLADAIVGETDVFLQVFGPTRCAVPCGEEIYRDAIQLRQLTLELRQAAAAGAPPCDLRALYQQVDCACGRLVGKVNRIARGRNGPNIQQVRTIGALCQELGAVL